ncbi:extracellular matrix FRAS1 [Micractinium conductrix]|uniref:Extracellular matrix FRAS1 n=1 Tax=Micractinium conductrix TaxID=554055 RepID=A0A2P6V809_9CHLO|nr:extracellular matrix FRAS1 [Micractinium conductrix]|eukprot:PSC70220.1 extracellular matrix FRAS1 [Micractinium conductrix]
MGRPWARAVAFTAILASLTCFVDAQDPCPARKGLNAARKCVPCANPNCWRCASNFKNCIECAYTLGDDNKPLRYLYATTNGTCEKCPNTRTDWRLPGFAACELRDGKGCNAAGHCEICPQGWRKASGKCLQCKVKNCMACPYTRHRCARCAAGFYLTAGGVCAQCLDPLQNNRPSTTCEACNPAKPNVCLKCLPGYGLGDEGACLKCEMSGPNDYDWHCWDCSTNYRTCQPGGCRRGRPDSGAPAAKGNGFVDKTKGKCASCPMGCANCDAGGRCLSCEPGWFVTAAGECSPCKGNEGLIDYNVEYGSSCAECTAADGNRRCAKCIGGLVTNANGTCVPCKAAACKRCADGLTTRCLECNEGYGLVGGACRLCRQPGCAQCDRNPRRCRECITRSWWNGSAWVVPMLDSERRRCHLFRYYDLYPGTPN